MNILSFCLGKLQRRAPVAETGGAGIRDADTPMISRREVGDAPRECEPPLSISELIAASSFLDFGGMLDERWLSGRRSDGCDADHRRI